jgi:hypothetical protein
MPIAPGTAPHGASLEPIPCLAPPLRRPPHPQPTHSKRTQALAGYSRINVTMESYGHVTREEAVAACGVGHLMPHGKSLAGLGKSVGYALPSADLT